MFTDSLDFRVHSARQHIKHHFIIRDERPQRILKTCRFVVFDEKMREPGESVADDKTKRQIKQVSAADYPNKQNQAERCADEMQIAR